MAYATISSKYQVVIPKDVREQLQLRTGQRLIVIVKGGVVHMVPERPIESFRGFLKGIDTTGLREDTDRL
jgi:AbrB family looped-hinge helix DNA binding protein